MGSGCKGKIFQCFISISLVSGEKKDHFLQNHYATIRTKPALGLLLQTTLLYHSLLYYEQEGNHREVPRNHYRLLTDFRFQKKSNALNGFVLSLTFQKYLTCTAKSPPNNYKLLLVMDIKGHSMSGGSFHIGVYFDCYATNWFCFLQRTEV